MFPYDTVTTSFDVRVIGGWQSEPGQIQCVLGKQISASIFDSEHESEYLKIIISLLWDKPEGVQVQEIMRKMSEVPWVKEDDQTVFPLSNMPQYEREIRLATIPLVRAGWLEKTRSRWRLTEAGRKACKLFSSINEFHAAVVRFNDEWKRNLPALPLITEKAEEKAWDQISVYLSALSTYEFRQLICDLLRAMNYHIVWVAPPSKVHGYIDILASSDPFGIKKPRMKVHVRHNGQAVVSEGLKAFQSVVGEDDYGLFVSSGGFVDVIKNQKYENNQIILMDLECFYEHWLEYYDQISQEAKQVFPVKPIYFLSLV